MQDENNPTTVNNAELVHHSKFSQEWWDVNGVLKALHSYNMLRVPFVRDGLVKVPQDNSLPLAGKKILEVGCGGGILCKPLAKLGADVTGVDAAKELIEMAQEHSDAKPPPTGNRPTYVYTTIEEHAETHANVYDGVVASEVIEHIDNDKKELFVKSCIQALKPGGRIFFTTPSRTRLSHIATIFIAENILKLAPKGTHQYDKFMTPAELRSLLEKNGCHVESVSGTFYYPFINKWQWISSTFLCFAMQAIKLED